MRWRREPDQCGGVWAWPKAEQRPQQRTAFYQLVSCQAQRERRGGQQRRLPACRQVQRLELVGQHHDHGLVQDVEREHRQGEVAQQPAVGVAPTVGKTQQRGDRRPLVHRPGHAQAQPQPHGGRVVVVVAGEVPAVDQQRIGDGSQQQRRPAQPLQ